MGELILCSQPLAAVPYYLEEASVNIYSLEELCYYIENNLYLLDSKFPNEELCGWVEKELGLTDTAEKMRCICKDGGSVFEFVLCILSESGYCTRQTIQQIAKTLQEMEHKSEYECRKIRADRFLENKKYVSSICEYRSLLQLEEKNPVLTGNVWHNLGCAYARLFFFRDAADCFRRAYELNENPESLREYLYTYRCRKDKSGFEQALAEFGLGEMERMEISSRLGETSSLKEIREFEQKMDVLSETGAGEAIKEQLAMWKDEYRNNCRV